MAAQPDPGSVRLRFRRLSGRSQTLLRTEGESGRFEFKRSADAVTMSVLVAAANAASLEGVSLVTILVGVDEFMNPDTGAVSGIVVGIEDMARSAGLIASRAANTRPIPIGLTVVEENLATKKPILRLEVRPTRPPHYTDNGQRVTRMGASTRAITDKELVEMYLEREARAFQIRFRETSGRTDPQPD